MCLIAKNQKKFQSARLKKSLYSFDKSDPTNLKLPSFIENFKDDNLYSLMPKVVKKYESLNYSLQNREEIDERSEWSDLEVLILIKFYKNSWSFKIPNENEFFPSFVFTYNIQPLKKEIDKIVSLCYDKIEEETSKELLKETFTFTALHVTYLLHFFVITHLEYIEEE